MNALSYRWNLAKLLRSRGRVLAAYKKQREDAAKEKKNRDEIEAIISGEMHEVGMIDEEIESFENRYLTESARKLLLPTPEFDVDSPAWTESTITGRFRLSKEAMMELRSAIRKERQDRREGAIKWIAALTGIIGALTGLVAVWGS